MTSVTVGDTTYDVVPGEVELGRLSVGRSPTKVLSHSLDEALAKLTTEGAVIAIDSSGRLTVDGVTIDSPLENLALYETYMTSGSIPGVTLPAGFDPAALLAAAGDKTGTISVDTVVYMTRSSASTPVRPTTTSLTTSTTALPPGPMPPPPCWC